MPKKEILITHSSGVNKRLDIFLSEKIKDLSRSQIKKLVEEDSIKINGQTRKPSYKLKVGDRVRIEYDLPRHQKIKPENIPIDILYKDEHIAVIHKPSGMVVHPGAGVRGETLVNALLHHFPDISEIGPEERPGIVHRLDKESSGVMVVARSLKAYRSLQRQFKQKEVEKQYIGLVWGRMAQKKGEITWSIGRHPKHGERISIKTKKPRSAETRYSVLREYEESTLLEIQPITGRTHQIRVHMAAAGHPIIGDNRYGRRKGKIRSTRLFLHACSLKFMHPETKEKVEFSSPLPQDLENILDKQINLLG